MSFTKFEKTYENTTGQALRPRPINAQEINELVTAELRHGDPRSEAYARGVFELLRSKILGATFPKPYEMGTAEADAYYAGRDRGLIVYRTLAPALDETEELTPGGMGLEGNRA